MSWFLFALSIIMVAWNAYYLFRGRELYRGLVFWNFILALQFLAVYILVIYDHKWMDIMTWQEVTGYLVKPLIASFAIISMVTTYFLGKRHDH